ncbi:MAG: hypothetical protein JO069_14945 [Verrucomicrobia bacterium]|nr:hypothetical protein [Verrucomicrobiota bacterium]
MKTLVHWIGATLLTVLLLGSAPAQEQTRDSHARPPLVYDVENTGAAYPTPVFPTMGQFPIIRPLPDPFVSFAEHRRDTSFESWERRRNEIKAAVEKFEIGPKPDCSDCTITASYTPPAAGSTAKGVLQVVVTRNGKSLTLTSGVFIPTGMGTSAFPVLIPMTFFASPTGANPGSLPASVVRSRPIATVDFVHNEVTALSFGHVDHSADAFYQLYPELCAGTCNGNVSNSGQYAAWSWGVSRLIDGMEIATHQAVNPLPVDMKHVAVTGCSYAGKMALFAGALDERIALTISQENGGGGAPSWRVSHEIEASGSVEDIHDTSYDWFGEQMLQFANDAGYKLPTDHHELMAMVAPRALLETGNTDFYWLSNRSNYVSARATQRIYDTFGIGDRFGFYIDGGHPHCGTLPAEAPAIGAYLDKFLIGNTSANTDVEVNPYPTLDYRRWTAWWGDDSDHDFGPRQNDSHPQNDDGDAFRDVVYPQFPNDWNTGGTVVMSLERGLHTQINSGDTVLGGYQLAVRGADHPAATVSLVSGNVQADIRCFDGSSYTLTLPLPMNQSYSIPAGESSFFPDPTTFQGSALGTQCSGVLEGAYFTALGISSAIGNPGGAGFTTTDTADPLMTRFQVSANGVTTRPSTPLVVNFQP